MSDELRDEPSIERVADLYSWAYAWRSRDGDDDTDLSALRKRNRAEFERALEVEIARRVAEARMAGYRDGFEAGQIKVFVPMKLPVRTPETRVTTPRCDCGHVASTHNSVILLTLRVPWSRVG